MQHRIGLHHEAKCSPEFTVLIRLLGKILPNADSQMFSLVWCKGKILTFSDEVRLKLI